MFSNSKPFISPKFFSYLEIFSLIAFKNFFACWGVNISLEQTLAFGEPGMLYEQKKGLIQRYPWKIEKSFKYNVNNISTNTSLFNNLTKRSGLG